jgi:pimeloyl-ACP methyl ester carboxylesterase
LELHENGIGVLARLYGTGEPLLLVHGNGGSIADFKAQIDYFRKRYKVIAMDSRDQGRSGDSPDKITYEKMTDDLAALLDHLNTGPVNVLGWSDGGIEALLLGIRHPMQVRKIAAMAANLNPTL